MDNHKFYVNVGGKMEELSPVSIGSSINAPETDGSLYQHIRDGMEMSIPIRKEDVRVLVEQMEKECSVVDITDWPAQMIKRLIFTFPRTSKLITRNPKHYYDLQMEEGFACVAGDYDTLFDVPLILDRKGKIKAAQVEIKRKGEDVGDGR